MRLFFLNLLEDRIVCQPSHWRCLTQKLQHLPLSSNDASKSLAAVPMLQTNMSRKRVTKHPQLEIRRLGHEFLYTYIIAHSLYLWLVFSSRQMLPHIRYTAMRFISVLQVLQNAKFFPLQLQNILWLCRSCWYVPTLAFLEGPAPSILLVDEWQSVLHKKKHGSTELSANFNCACAVLHRQRLHCQRWAESIVQQYSNFTKAMSTACFYYWESLHMIWFHREQMVELMHCSNTIILLYQWLYH